MKTIRYAPAAVDQLAGLAAQVRGRIVGKLHEFAMTGGGNVSRLSGGLYGARLRVGPWRVLFTETVDIIDVWAVGHRNSIYKRETT